MSKSLHTLGLALKLYEPLMTAFAVFVHKHRSCRVVADGGSRSLAGHLKSTFGIIHYQFFSKGIDERLGAPRDDKFVRIHRSKTHRVAYQVTPQTTARGDDHSIVDALLHFP